MRCDDALGAISAAADGEVGEADAQAAVDEHLAACPDCAAFERTLLRTRAQLRFEPIAAVPDVAPRVLARLPRPRRGGLVRVAAVAAAIGMLVGAAFVGLGRDSQPPAAADLPRRVLAAQHDIRSLDVEFGLTEHGRPDEAGALRRFDGRLSYRAPESLALTLTERSPVAEPADGDVRLVVDDDQLRLETVRVCFSCREATLAWQQTVTGREPFSEAAPIPLELVTAVDSFALAAPPRELGRRAIAGHTAIGVRVPAAQVARFLDALAPAGDLRAVHPADPVDVWLEQDHLVPVAVEVRAAEDEERARWAAALGYRDRPGETVLAFRARTIDINETDDAPPPEVEAGPGAPDEVRDDGFRVGGTRLVPQPERLREGLRPHVSGTVVAPGGPRVEVRSWTGGRAWLKVRATAEWDQPRLFGDLGPAVREIDLGRGGRGYQSADGRKVALHAGGLDVVLSGSLPADELRAVAASLGIRGRPIPSQWPEASTASLADARAARPGLLVPSSPDGFAAPAVRISGDIVTQSYVGPGDRRFVLSQGPGELLSTPADRDSLGVQVRGVAGRYSFERGDLEWVEAGSVVSLSSPTLSLAELLAIADTLTRP